MKSTPLVSVVLATHDAAGTLGTAMASVLRQTVRDLELVVVDDASADGTPALLDGVGDPRLVVLRNDERLGLARSLDRGFETARARWIARLDADDVAMPDRIERQLAALHARPGLALLGTAALELDEAGAPSRLHEMPAGDAVRWHLLFSCPFFHPSVVVDADVLRAQGLAYDAGFEESEDYDVWARLLRVADGDNLAAPLLLKRVHPGQATRRRRDLQRSFQRQVALREIAHVAPDLSVREAELAWRLVAGEAVAGEEHDAAVAVRTLLDVFESSLGRRVPAARASVARVLARAGAAAGGEARADLLRQAAETAPAALPAVALRRLRRGSRTSAAAREARAWLRALAAPGAPLRVVLVSPEPTPYRAPLIDRVAARPEIDLTVVYAARTVAGRGWTVEPAHRALYLRGLRVPGLRRVLRHDYPVTPGILSVLADAAPDAVVVSGWSTFASQAALAWCRRRSVPYLLLVSSHERGERPGWRRALRRAVVPRVVRGAAGWLALGTLSRDALVAAGARPGAVRVFANTVDVPAWAARADELAASRPALREALGLGDDDVAVLSVGRLAPEKGLDTLLRAAAAGPHVVVVLAGSGPERERLVALARDLGVRLVLAGDVPHERLAETYVAADVFALLSSWEPWGVVVNEAAACGLPLVLSDQVGAAPDLLRDGENGTLVAAGDVDAAADALRRLAADPDARRRAGAASRRIVAGWGYEPSIERFVEAVREAASR